MTDGTRTTTVGQLPTPNDYSSRVPTTLTRLVWLLWIASLGAMVVQFRGGDITAPGGPIAVDGLTVVMWTTVTFFSGIVHSYSLRYMAGNRTIDRFFGGVFGFTLIVMALVAANDFVLFGLAWLAMGLVMADLIGHVEGWPQARAAAALARRSFLTSSGSLAVALATLWWYSGVTTVSGATAAVGTLPAGVVVVAAGALLLAAMVQSALLPFHTWLLASMTAPTPASALMHAGFVNAGGVLLLRFAPVVTADATVMLAAVSVGAASALLGKLLKSVRTDVKGQLGCSTVGQMGFMIMQAGFGFFGAAITHLVVHGFYKAYQFLSAGDRVTHESPRETETTRSTGPVGLAVVVLTALAGGALFAALTGKGTAPDGGLLLAALVVLMVLQAARTVVGRTALPATVRYGAVPLVALPAIGIYAAVYRAVTGLLTGLPAFGWTADLTVVHGVVAVAFVAAYVAIETGVYRRSTRLYVALVNAGRSPSGTLLTTTEDYDEY